MNTKLCEFLYRSWTPILRVLERCRIHNYRQPFHIGTIKLTQLSKIETMLREKGFEPAILAWKDPGECLSLRKPDGMHQYHLRVFDDGEVRGHYEFLPEARPLAHCAERLFEPREQFFKNHLRGFLSTKLTKKKTISTVDAVAR